MEWNRNHPVTDSWLDLKLILYKQASPLLLIKVYTICGLLIRQLVNRMMQNLILFIKSCISNSMIYTLQDLEALY